MTITPHRGRKNFRRFLIACVCVRTFWRYNIILPNKCTYIRMCECVCAYKNKANCYDYVYLPTMYGYILLRVTLYLYIILHAYRLFSFSIGIHIASRHYIICIIYYYNNIWGRVGYALDGRRSRVLSPRRLIIDVAHAKPVTNRTARCVVIIRNSPHRRVLNTISISYYNV